MLEFILCRFKIAENKISVEHSSRVALPLSKEPVKLNQFSQFNVTAQLVAAFFFAAIASHSSAFILSTVTLCTG